MILANLGIVFYRKIFELGEVVSALLTRELIPLLSVFEVVVVFVFLLQGRRLTVTSAIMGALLDDGALDRLDQHEGPDQVEQLEQAEQDEEEVVEGRELEEVASVKKRGLQDPEREYSAPAKVIEAFFVGSFMTSILIPHLVTIQVSAKSPKKTSQAFWNPVYFNSLANSNRWSEQSCTRITRVPTCCNKDKLKLENLRKWH